MDTIEETRLKRLVILMNEFKRECPKAAAFAEKIKKSESQLTQWLTKAPDSKTKKPRSINSKSAREIEYCCNKPAWWMDQPVMDEIEKLIDALETIRATPKDKIIMVRASMPDSDKQENIIKENSFKK